MSTVLVFSFAPFASRRGDMVIGLRVYGRGKWHRKKMRTALREYCLARSGAAPVGGWLNHSRCFFVERTCWPDVAHAVRAAVPTHRVRFRKVRRPETVVHYSKSAGRDQLPDSWTWSPTQRTRRAAARALAVPP